MPFSSGPQPQARTVRQALLDGFVKRLIDRYGQRLLCIALYGSMAREEDGPFSDIELFCVLDEPGLDQSLEWIYGPGKAEINLLGLDVARQAASQVDEYWSLSQGQFVHARLLDGQAALLDELRQRVLTVPQEELHLQVSAIIVGELYEWMGKVRGTAGADLPLAPLACSFTEMLAMALGLAHRHLFTTGLRMLPESLVLPDRPQGYDLLCRMVMAGELHDRANVIKTLEAAWAGLDDWTARRAIHIPIAAWPDD